jgi:hypothetical protein
MDDPCYRLWGTGHKARFDFIVASHVIEHTTDMLGWLRDCSALLKADGKLVLFVPDCMYCFDLLRPLSSTGQILQAFIEKRVRHPPGVGFDHLAYIVTREGHCASQVGDNRPLAFINELDDRKVVL